MARSPQTLPNLASEAFQEGSVATACEPFEVVQIALNKCFGARRMENTKLKYHSPVLGGGTDGSTRSTEGDRKTCKFAFRAREAHLDPPFHM
jgi:hypothetical protein